MSGPSRWLVVVGLVVLLGVGTVVAGAATTDGSTTIRTDGNASLSPDSTLLHVSVAPDGTATWRVEYHFQLTDDGERDAFASYRRDVESTPSAYEASFADDIRPAVTAAENETGRDMSLSNVTVAVREQQLGQPTGIVTYTFTWTQFAVADGDQLRIGDAISGFYVGPDTRLTLAWPTEYRLDSAVPSPDAQRDRRLSWDGELGFGVDEPRVVVSPTETATAATPGDTTGTNASSLLLLGTVGVGLVVLATGVVLYVRRRDAGSPDTVSEDLLSDEEQALAVLRERGGRLKQQELAEACGWGDSKTSRVVNRLREEDAVTVFRLGRENVITLPEETDE